MFFCVEPEVAGGIGPRSEMHRDGGKLVVTRLHYQFDGWLGDALLETTPCFIVTDTARRMIENAALTGVGFSDVEISRSNIFIDLHGDRSLPRFWWMIVDGRAESDDFGISGDLMLITSARALAILESAGITHANVEALGG